MPDILNNPTTEGHSVKSDHLVNEQKLFTWRFISDIESLDPGFDLSLLRAELHLMCTELERMYATFRACGVDIDSMRMKPENILN